MNLEVTDDLLAQLTPTERVGVQRALVIERQRMVAEARKGREIPLRMTDYPNARTAEEMAEEAKKAYAPTCTPWNPRSMRGPK